MTLKTFHFAGVAGMSITQCVPLFFFNDTASTKISTPVIQCELNNRFSERAGREAKACIEKTYLRDIIDYIADVWSPTGAHLHMRIDKDTIDKLSLHLEPHEIERAILTCKALKLSKDGSLI